MASTNVGEQEIPARDRLDILLAGEEGAVDAAAREAGLDTVSWIRRTLVHAIEARDERATADPQIERKLLALVEATGHSFPTADIEDMLRETEAGRWIRG